MPNRPGGCTLQKPTKSSIRFGTKWINISAISRAQGLPIAYISRILAGKQDAPVRNLRKIASSIGMGLEELLDTIETRKHAIEEHKSQVVLQYVNRVRKENQERARLKREGKIVPPPMPGMRLPDDEIV